jgi:biopolymer transport protein TolQ
MFNSTTPLAATTDVFFTAYAQSDFFGRLIILGLIAVSLICWLVLLKKGWQSKSVRKLGAQFLKALGESKHPILSIDFEKLPKAKSEDIPHPFASVFKAVKLKTLEILEKNHYFLRQLGENKETQVFLSASDLELIESHCLTVISSEIKRLERNLYILSTIVTLAPFLGLLGTVWGILVTFSGLQGGVGSSSNAAILGGLSTALATTVLGLIIAIPALIAFNTLRASLKNITSDLEDFSYYLLGQLELEYRKVEVR